MKQITKYIILVSLVLPFIFSFYLRLESFNNPLNKKSEEECYPLLSDIMVGEFLVPGVSSSLSLDQVIKIGVLDDLGSISGEHTLNGALLAAKEINLAGGIDINGSQYYIGITAENTEEANPNLDVNKAVTAAQTMINEQDPHFIIGGYRTEAVLAYQEVIMDNHIPFMGTGCSTDIFCQYVNDDYNRYKYFFRVMPLNLTSKARELLHYIEALANFLGTEFSGTVDKVAILREDLSWSDTLSFALSYYLPMIGLTVVEDIAFPIDVNMVEMTSYMSTIDASGAQILIPLISGQGGILMNNAYEMIQPKCLIAGFDSVGELASYWSDSNGACEYEVIMQHTYRTNKTALTIPFWDAYTRQYHQEPFYTGVGAYDAVRLLMHAVNNSQSFDPDIIVSTLEAKTPSVPFLGASGNIAFTFSHDLIEGWPYNTYMFCQWQPGGLKQVIPTYNTIYPNSISTAPLIIPHWGIDSLTEDLYPPEEFSLTTDAENPDTDGNFNITWTLSRGAESYSIFSSNSPISSLSQNLKLLKHQYDNSSYEITNLRKGNYYFIIASYNTSGITLSNSIYVNVSRPSPGPFMLNSDAEDPEINGNFNLSWTLSEGADNYSVYKYTKPIIEINETLEVIAYQNAISPFFINETINGIYYYIVEANNATGSTLSNFIYVNVHIFDSLTVINPNSSSSWEIFTFQSIIWTSTGSIINVKIELYRNDIFLIDIISNMPNDGEMEWLVLSGLVASDQYKIKVIDLANSSIFAYSEIFEITTPTQQELPVVPGYNIHLILCMVLAVSVVLTKKRFKKPYN